MSDKSDVAAGFCEALKITEAIVDDMEQDRQDALALAHEFRAWWSAQDVEGLSCSYRFAAWNAWRAASMKYRETWQVEPVAWLFHIRYIGKGKGTEFAAIDYTLQEGEELLSKKPLYAAPASRTAAEKWPFADQEPRAAAQSGPDSVVCHAPGDKCLGCDHYYGKAPVCKYAPEAAPTDSEGWSKDPNHWANRAPEAAAASDNDARWVEIQAISRKVAYQDGAPSEIESALCGAVVRAKELESSLAAAKREIATLKDGLRLTLEMKRCQQQRADELRAANPISAEQYDEAVTDARRYRWLRDESQKAMKKMEDVNKYLPCVILADNSGGIADYHLQTERLDAAIDAALDKEGKS